MGLTNIFLGRYKQDENQLTYCLLSLLEHLEPSRSAALLSCGNSRFDAPLRVAVKTLYGGSTGNPDGSVWLDYGSSTAVVFLEVTNQSLV